MADESSDVVVVVRSAEQFAERLMKKLTLDITANLIEDTPVDTGWARANWVPQIGEPYIIESQDLSRPERAARVEEASQRQSEGLASISSYNLIQGTINVTNNVPYIELLNEGSSKQAPAAFVQRSIERAIEQNAAVT